MSDVKDGLKSRFNGLPMHKICYYQAYNDTDTTIARLEKVISKKGSWKLRGLEDCLGMTPLHILACSKKQDMRVWKFLSSSPRFPEMLATEDMWGCLPIFYAFANEAPLEIILFLLQNYRLFSPGDQFYVGKQLVKELSVCGVSLDSIKFILKLPELAHVQSTDWEQVILDMAKLGRAQLASSRPQTPSVPIEIFRYLFDFSITDRVNKLGIKQWRMSLKDHTQAIPDEEPWRMTKYEEVILKLDKAECFYKRLKEATSILELAIWKTKMDESELYVQTRNMRSEMHTSYRHGREYRITVRKKMKIDKEGFRDNCRVTCGADITISNVLPYRIQKI